MKRTTLRKWLVLGGMLLAAAALADYNVSNHGTHYQNASTGARTDASGNATMNDAARDRDNFQVVPVCDDTLSNGAGVGTAWTLASAAFTFTAESSAVIPTYSYRRFTLMVRVIPPAGDTTNRLVRLAVQVRKHTDATGDSSSTFGWTSWANTSVVAAADTAGYGVLISGNSALPYNNERVFIMDALRGRGVGATNQPNGSWPDGIAVDLMDSRGQWYWAPYTSVRIRLIGYAGSGKPRVIAKLAMGS